MRQSGINTSAAADQGDAAVIVLAFDTTGRVPVAALVADGRTLASRHWEPDQGLAAQLLPNLLAVLDDAGVVLRDLDGLSLSVGPGSFTGTRTGLAAAHGLRMALGIAVYGYSAFDVALACTQPEDPTGPADIGVGATTVVLPTHRRDLFVQRLRAPGQPLEPPAILLPEKLLESVEDSTDVWVVATGAESVLAEAADPRRPLPSSRPKLHGEAAALAGLALRQVPCYPLLPLYVRAPAVSIPSAAR